MPLVEPTIWIDDVADVRGRARPRRSRPGANEADAAIIGALPDLPVAELLGWDEPSPRRRPAPRQPYHPAAAVDLYPFPEWVSQIETMSWESGERPPRQDRPRRYQSTEGEYQEIDLPDEVTQAHWRAQETRSLRRQARASRLSDISPHMEDPEAPTPILDDGDAIRRPVAKRRPAEDRIAHPIPEDSIIGWVWPDHGQVRRQRELMSPELDPLFTSQITVDGLFVFEGQPRAPRFPPWRPRAQEMFPQSAYVAAFTVAGPFWVAAGEITLSGYAVAGMYRDV